MRTNIEIDDVLMEQAQALSGLKTKRAVVEEALRLLVRVRRQQKVLDLAGKVEWVGNLEEMRRSRDFGDSGR